MGLSPWQLLITAPSYNTMQFRSPAWCKWSFTDHSRHYTIGLWYLTKIVSETSRNRLLPLICLFSQQHYPFCVLAQRGAAVPKICKGADCPHARGTLGRNIDDGSLNWSASTVERLYDQSKVPWESFRPIQIREVSSIDRFVVHVAVVF